MHSGFLVYKKRQQQPNLGTGGLDIRGDDSSRDPQIAITGESKSVRHSIDDNAQYIRARSIENLPGALGMRSTLFGVTEGQNDSVYCMGHYARICDSHYRRCINQDVVKTHA